MQENILNKLKKLKKWKLKPILNGKLFSMLIIGSRRSGKSYMVRHLWNLADFNNYYDHVIIFCNSNDVIEYYSEFVSGSLFFKEYDEEIIKRIMQLSEHYKTKGKPK